ncbi:MAG: InlB B-repeat-containing protein, partial [Clostridia bacterium]|nr:InlB B-repeat-containing protein [Clostridia bacterium]
PLSCAKLKEEWEKIDPSFGVYSFTFDANGGTMGPDTAFNTKYGKDFTVLNTVTVKKGFTFAGWYVKRNADSKFVVAEGYWSTESEIAQNGYHLQVYPNGKILNFNYSWTKEYDGVSSYTFYAIWTALPTYTVRFDANGGTDAPVDQIKIQGEALRLTNDAPKRESYFFRGWSTTPDAQKIDYFAGTLYEQNADITLYAVWGKNIILGDVNCDGEIDSMDAVETFKYDAGLVDLDADQLFAADVNGDGEADSSDAVMILKYDAGIIDAI